MRALGDPAELSEERRLAYVGITRAKERLYVTRSLMRASWGQPVSNPESRFLQEIRSISSTGGVLSPSGRRGVSGDRRAVSSAIRRGEAGRGGSSSWSPDPARRGGSRSVVNYEVGDRNNHPKYGLGKVISKQGSGPAERLVIDYGREWADDVHGHRAARRQTLTAGRRKRLTRRGEALSGWIGSAG